MQNVSQFIKFDCERVEPDIYMQKSAKLTHFTASKTDITKFLWGGLGHHPHKFLGVGAIAPKKSARMEERVLHSSVASNHMMHNTVNMT